MILTKNWKIFQLKLVMSLHLLILFLKLKMLIPQSFENTQTLIFMLFIFNSTFTFIIWNNSQLSLLFLFIHSFFSFVFLSLFIIKVIQIMSNKSQGTTLPQISKQQPPVTQPSILISPSFQHKENHLSSTYENLLRHEQQNFQIQNLTKNVKVSKTAVEAQMKEPLVASTLKGEQIFQKYGSLIQNQPIFLRQLIFHNYLSYLPSKFQDQFSQIMLVGSGFQFAWWGSLALVLFRAYRNRNIEASGRQKAAKTLGLGFLFLASSLGFHEQYYIPRLRKCYYTNIKSIDSLMDRHIKILRSCGADFQDRNEQIKNINNQIKGNQDATQKVKIVPQIKSIQKQIKR